MLPAIGRGSSSSAKEAATLSQIWGGREAEGGGEAPRSPSPPLNLAKGAPHRFRQLALSSKAPRSTMRSLGVSVLQKLTKVAPPSARPLCTPLHAPHPPRPLSPGTLPRQKTSCSTREEENFVGSLLDEVREPPPIAAAAPAEAEAKADGQQQGESGGADERGEGSGEPVPLSPAVRPYSATNGADPQPPPSPPTAPATEPAVAGNRAPMPSAVEVAAAVAERGALFAHEGGRKASLSKEGSRGRPRGVSMERPSGEGAVSFVEASYSSQGEQHAISVVAGALEELGECHSVAKAGGGFGEPALLHGTPRALTAVTLTPDTLLVVVPKREYDKLVRALIAQAVARKIALVRGVLPTESLAHWSDAQLQRLAYTFGEQGGNLERPPRGERLQRVGEPPSHVWIVVSGEVCVLQHLAADDGGAGGAAAMVQVAAYGPGSLVGELSPSGGACSATLMVGSTDAQLLRSDRLEFFAKLALDDESHAHIVAAFARQRDAWHARRLTLTACSAGSVARRKAAEAEASGGGERELPIDVASGIRFLPSALTFMDSRHTGKHTLWDRPKRLPTPGEVLALASATRKEQQRQEQEKLERRQLQLQEQSRAAPKRATFQPRPPSALNRRREEPPSPRSALTSERQDTMPPAGAAPKESPDLDCVVDAPPEEAQETQLRKGQASLFVSLRRRGEVDREALMYVGKLSGDAARERPGGELLAEEAASTSPRGTLTPRTPRGTLSARTPSPRVHKGGGSGGAAVLPLVLGGGDAHGIGGGTFFCSRQWARRHALCATKPTNPTLRPHPRPRPNPHRSPSQLYPTPPPSPAPPPPLTSTPTLTRNVEDATVTRPKSARCLEADATLSSRAGLGGSGFDAAASAATTILTRNGRPLHGTLHPHDANAHALASPRRSSGTMPLKRMAIMPWESYSYATAAF